MTETSEINRDETGNYQIRCRNIKNFHFEGKHKKINKKWEIRKKSDKKINRWFAIWFAKLDKIDKWWERWNRERYRKKERIVKKEKKTKM